MNLQCSCCSNLVLSLEGNVTTGEFHFAIVIATFTADSDFQVAFAITKLSDQADRLHCFREVFQAFPKDY